MKKMIVLLLATIMCLSLIACGGESTSTETSGGKESEVQESETVVLTEEAKETLIDTAVPYTYEDLHSAFGNKAAATVFIDNAYSFEAEVSSIEKDYAVLEFRIPSEDGKISSWSATDLCAHVYLPVEELIDLVPEQIIVVAGKCSDVIATSTTAFGSTYEGTAIVFEEAYITQEYFEITGTLRGKNHSYEGAWNIQIGNSSYMGLVYFADGVDLSGFTEEHRAGYGEEVTILAKRADGYRDATIVEQP